MDENDLPLVVPVSALSDYFQCSICMCSITATTVTVCGHRYCEKCIKEWVGRKHTCPCCNKHLTIEQLFKDHQFDSLIATVEGEKEKSESKYFENLINEASNVQNKEEESLSAVELVLKKHLKQGLSAHEKYFQSLKRTFQQKKTLLESQTTKAIGDLQTHELSQEELMQQSHDLEETLERQKEELARELAACAQLVADAYDKYLTSHIPNLDVLPVRASIKVLNKTILISDAVLKPTDTIADVKSIVEAAMRSNYNPVVSWEDDVNFFLFGPFAKCSKMEAEQITGALLQGGEADPDVQLIREGCRLGLQYGMKPGSEIIITGTVKCESDLPKRCFVDVFSKGKGQKVDYFSCQDCGFKWICRSCIEVCHQGHKVVPYILNHQPTWACCYCPKKKKCTIKSNDS